MNSIATFQGNSFIFKNRYPAPIVYNTINKNFAGTGTASSTGDGGQASSATLNAPSCVACDICGNIYIGEWNGNRIRKIDAQTGIISTIAGNGIQSISFNQVGGIVVDKNNPPNVYFSNFNAGNNGNIYRIDGSGTITSICATPRPLGVTLDYNGDLYFTGNQNNYYKISNPSSATPGTATLLLTSVDYTQAIGINSSLQLFISVTFGALTFGYYNLIGGTYSSSPYNNLYSKIGSQPVGSICFNSSDICYVLTTSNILWISTNNSYTTFNQFSLNSSLSLNLSNTTQNAGFDVSNNFYIPNTNSNKIIKVTNITS